jgi:ABC-type glycerol-3-phosphate transport system substrate-binding protein
MMKRASSSHSKFKSVQFILLAFILLFGLTMGVIAEGQREEAAAEEETGPVKLVFWEHQFPELVKWSKQRISEYESENPDVQIEFMIDYAHKRMLPAMYAGKGPDLAGPHGPKVVKLMMMDYLSPVHLDAFPEFDTYEELEDAYYPNSLSQFKMDGKIWALPSSYVVPGVVVNKQLFNKAGLNPNDPNNLPTNWKEMGEIGGKIFGAIGTEGGEVKYEGWDWYYYRDSWQRVVLRTIFAQYGAAFVNSDGEVVIDSPEAVEALTMMRDMIHKYETGDPAATPGAEGLDWQIFNGTIAMGRFLHGQIAKTVSAPEVKEHIMLAKYPSPEGKTKVLPVRTHSYCVNGKSSERKQLEAWRFINYMTQNWKQFAIGGQNPARIIQPDLEVPWYESDWFKEQQQKYQSIRDFPIETLAKGNVVYQTGRKLYGTDEAVLRADEITDIVADAQERIIMKGESVEKALGAAKEEIERILMVNQ